MAILTRKNVKRERIGCDCDKMRQQGILSLVASLVGLCIIAVGCTQGLGTHQREASVPVAQTPNRPQADTQQQPQTLDELPPEGTPTATVIASPDSQAALPTEAVQATLLPPPPAAESAAAQQIAPVAPEYVQPGVPEVSAVPTGGSLINPSVADQAIGLPADLPVESLKAVAITPLATEPVVQDQRVETPAPLQATVAKVDLPPAPVRLPIVDPSVTAAAYTTPETVAKSRSYPDVVVQDVPAGERIGADVFGSGHAPQARKRVG